MNGELNALTRRLYAQGYTRENHPDTVYWSDWQNFGYKWETMLGFTWETPCGIPAGHVPLPSDRPGLCL